jgi:hypothetical protein
MEISQEQKAYSEIIQKAWDDADFKNELIVNPVATIEKLIGKPLNIPAGKSVVVKDQTDESIIYINIPAKASSSLDKELTEEQLEFVAGGVKIDKMVQYILKSGLGEIFN